MQGTDMFNFKQKSQDFIVEEKLPFELSGKGDAFFVFFEKRNVNTMDVVNHLCSNFNISRKALGIAGLKDKKAITRQWISIYKSTLKKIGGEKIFLNSLAEKVKILKTNHHEKPIGMTTHIENIFYIRLRANKNLSQKEKDLTQKKMQYLFDNGFPNFFGEQRFGINERNWKQGKQIIEGKLTMNKKAETIFKLQAYASKMFNEYVISRTKRGLKLIDGDIVNIKNTKQLGVFHDKTKKVKIIKNLFEKAEEDKLFFRYPTETKEEITINNNNIIPTGPVIGYNLLSCKKNTEAGLNEQSFLMARRINKNNLELFKKYKIFGIRRNLRVFPNDVNMKFQNDDLLISFALPSGTYASVLIDEMLEKI